MRKKSKLVCGVGVNDLSDPTHVVSGGKRRICEFYRAWSGMLARCYRNDFLERHPSYAECKVCDEWLIFSNFKKWMQAQDWKGKSLDKDIIFVGKKTYSPDRCVFVDAIVNTFVLERSASRGSYKIGVFFCKKRKKYLASCSNPFTKKVENLGGFYDEDSDHNAWKSRKGQLAIELANLQKDLRVASAIIDRYKE